MHNPSHNRLLSLLAAISLLPAAILICGYFSIAGPTLTDVRLSPAAQLRSLSLEMDTGRIRIWLTTQTLPPGTNPSRTIRWTARPSLPDLRRSFWEFDNHSLNSVPKNQGATAYIIAFPIWCALVPFLIAPILWLRQRRRSKPQISQAGFPIKIKGN